jgi:prepilin-type N-terminal cleavage/methylation domain-containing protein
MKLGASKAGLTLPEILIVISIMVVLCATTWLVVAPRVKTKALETGVAEDLHQFSVAVNTYMVDHDDNYPNWPRDLPKGTPLKVRNFKSYLGNPAYDESVGQGFGPYVLTYHLWARLAEKARSPRVPWDANKWPIVNSPLLKKSIGTKQKLVYGGCFYPPVLMDVNISPTFVGYLDGHVHWLDWNDWQKENTACVTQGVGR